MHMLRDSTVLFIFHTIKSTKASITQDAKGPPRDRRNGLSDSSHCGIDDVVMVDAISSVE